MSRLMITGEFMELTHTTRNTLIHYDNTGLLKPIRTNGRGDRFYHPFQFYEMYLIRLIRSAGLSLEQVKDFMSAINTVTFDKLYEKWKESFKQQRIFLRNEYGKTQTTLNFVDKISIVSEHFNRFIPNSRPVIMDYKIKGSFYMYFLPEKCRMEQNRYYEYCNKMILHCYGKLPDGMFPVISCFDAKDFMNGECNVYALASYTLDKRIGISPDYSDIDMKYVFYRSVGDVSELYRGIEKVNQFIAENRLKICSDIKIITNLFMTKSDRVRVGDRLVCVPVVEADYDKEIKLADRDNLQKVINEVNTEPPLSSGQFIKLCQITRNTLNYYESQGLFEAEYIEENGYKKYGVQQIYTMIYIKALKQAGFSIEEIGNILSADNIGTENFFNRHKVLSDKRNDIAANLEKIYNERIRLHYMASALRNLEKITNYDHDFMTISDEKYLGFKKVNGGEIQLEEYDLFTELKVALSNVKEETEVIAYPITLVFNGTRKNATVSSAFLVSKDYNGGDAKQINGEFYVEVIQSSSEKIPDKVFETVEMLVSKKGRIIRDEILVMILSVNYDTDKDYSVRCLLVIPTR